MSAALLTNIALLTPAVFGCSNDGSSTTENTESTGTESSGPPTSPSAAASTDASVPGDSAPTGGAAQESTSSAAPSQTSTTTDIPTPPDSAGATPPTSPPAVSSPATDPPAAASDADPDGVLVDASCTDRSAASSQDFDLGHLLVERRQSEYHLDAEYSGPSAGHNVLVSFDLGGSTYKIEAELFENGTGSAQVLDPDAAEGVLLDPPQVITGGRIDLVVGSDQIGKISGSAFAVSVSLKVDGIEVETCP